MFDKFKFSCLLLTQQEEQNERFRLNIRTQSGPHIRRAAHVLCIGSQHAPRTLFGGALYTHLADNSLSLSLWISLSKTCHVLTSVTGIISITIINSSRSNRLIVISSTSLVIKSFSPEKKQSLHFGQALGFSVKHQFPYKPRYWNLCLSLSLSPL